MADKHDRWLDREASERLLRGESPDNAVADAAHDEAERLARTLGALAASAAAPPPADEELPGEAAALAAFRKVHADRHDLAARAGHAGAAALSGAAGRAGRAGAPGAPEPAGDGDAGLVRIGGRGEQSGRRPRRGRPVRLGLAAALAVGMIGGVSVATAAGYLPTPFDDQLPGPPAASVSASASSDGRPLGSPAPTLTPGDGGGSAPEPGASAADRDAAGKGDDASGAPEARGARPSGVTSSCRELVAGKTLDRERRRRLEKLAGGAQRVQAYCAAVLDGARAGSGSAGRDTGKGQSGRGSGSGGGDAAGQQGADDKGGRGGSDDDDDPGREGHGRGRGHGRGHGHGHDEGQDRTQGQGHGRGSGGGPGHHG
ncbi:hypothetical protein P1S61_01745 [Streptomyces sp. ME08-AFT2]|uniref:hypothetical protein n=1 Tax=Streptomyces sp. ME08-AFT2 TaxID=3028683 RepID=UPI0029AE4B10|nr:hypothetical protein [Streptomyces sp. ME08-AFT2]MDX3307848.1 hypothetical protein [Streptomyces sp. ME08-AFT2]